MFLPKVFHVLYGFHDKVQVSWVSHPNCIYVVPDYISSLNITLNIQNIRAYIFLFPEFTMLFRRIWIYLMKEVMFKMTLKGEPDIDK